MKRSRDIPKGVMLSLILGLNTWLFQVSWWQDTREYFECAMNRGIAKGRTGMPEGETVFPHIPLQ